MKLRKSKKNGKMICVCMALVMVLGLSTSAFAVDKFNHSDANTVLEISDNVVIEKINGTVLYVYESENLVFCSQLEENGMLLFSYMYPGSSMIYESKPFTANDFMVLRSVDNIDSITALNSMLIENIDMFESHVVLDWEDMSRFSARAASIDGMVNATFGTPYQNKFLASKTMKYDRSYQFYCYGMQANRRMAGDAFWFAAGTSLSTIYSWIKGGGFGVSLDSFLSLAGGTTDILSGFSLLADEISGSAYTYECSRIKHINQPFGRVATAQIGMKECRQTTAFLIK